MEQPKAQVKKQQKKKVYKNKRKDGKNKKRVQNKVVTKDASATLQQRKAQIRSLVPKNPDPLASASNLVCDVKIVADLCTNAFWTFPFGLIGMLSTKIDTVDSRLLGYYWALLNDFNLILFNKVPLLEQKPYYVAALFNSFKPKTIKTLRGNLTYSWATGFNYVGTPQTTTNIRSTTWSFQEPTGVDTGVIPQACAVMSVANIDVAVQNFSDLNQLLLNDSKMFQVVAYTSVNIYEQDVSAFSRASPYFGSGSCTSGAAYNSTENELPASSMPTLGTFVNFASPSNRVSRKLQNGSGDAVSAFSYAFLPGWTMDNYRTVHTPIFKFLDFSEVYVVASQWMAHALGLAFSNLDVTVESLWAPIPQGAFIGALRQTLMQYFLESQCVGQCLTYDDGTFFEPFHIQPNTAPKISQSLLLPAPLVEQLRALAAKIYKNEDRVASREKNVMAYIPVWGINPGSTAWHNPQVIKTTISQVSLFDNTDGYADSINWVDGRNGSGYVYLNSNYFQGAITQWNLWATWVEQYSGATSQLSGTAACNFLSMSRMINQNTVEFNMQEYPEWLTNVPLGYKRDVIVRKQSKGKEEIKKVLVKIQNSGTDFLTNEVTTTISSYQPLKADFTSYAPLIILPKYIVSEDTGPTAQDLNADKLQIANREFFFIRNQANTIATQLSNRFAELINMGNALAPGTAKDASTEFDRVAVWMQNMGKGGFIQDILGGASSIAGLIGI